MRIFRFLALLLVILSVAPVARGHQVPSVELEFLNYEGKWRLLGEMDIAYMLPEMRIHPDGPPLKRSEVMNYPPAELARIRRETENTLRKLLRFTFAGEEIPWDVEFPDFEKEPFELPPEAGDIGLISVRLVMDERPGAGDLRIHWDGERETELIVLIGDGEMDGEIIAALKGESIMLLRQTGGGTTAPVEKPVASGFLQSGFHHVIQLDHILFLLGLFLLRPEWKPLVRQSLLFTLAHSLTLALAAFGLVHLPGRWVEIAIALSIAWIGVENLITRRLGVGRILVVFAFGLVHGLGFASVLADKLAGVSRERLAGPLIGFNVGVELAQISVLAVAFVLLLPIRKWTPQVRTGGSVLIALAGLVWAGEMLFKG